VSDEYPNNPDVGPRCGECRLGLGTHDERDPYCDYHPSKDEQENK